MKKKKYSQIKKEERDEISILLKKGYSLREIAHALGRDPGAISREIKRNRKKNGSYDPRVAHHRAYVRRKYAKYQGKKINENNDLKKYLLEGLKRYWSPDGVSGRMRYEGKPFSVSKTAIYEWLYSSYGQYWCQYLYSRRYRPRKRKEKKLKKTLIPNRKGLELRPKEANERLVLGHYEGDTMVSGRKTGSKTALSVISDRFSRQIEAEKIPALKPRLFNKAVTNIKERISAIKSFTLDNGVENSKYEELKIPTYFCDPYSSWQKGGVENAIKMIRWFIPKGTDIAKYSDEYVSMVVDILNNKPRKSLGYKTPLEVMIEDAPTTFNYQNLEIKKTEGVALRG